jgi:ATP/maltotriose-dependent transcriptional regulator MalT
VIEPAKASEIASIVVEAYRLTGREVQVARLVARGLSTNEIASTLFLSPTPSATTSRPSFRRSASPPAAS